MPRVVSGRGVAARGNSGLESLMFGASLAGGPRSGQSRSELHMVLQVWKLARSLICPSVHALQLQVKVLEASAPASWRGSLKPPSKAIYVKGGCGVIVEGRITCTQATPSSEEYKKWHRGMAPGAVSKSTNNKTSPNIGSAPLSNLLRRLGASNHVKLELADSSR